MAENPSIIDIGRVHVKNDWILRYRKPERRYVPEEQIIMERKLQRLLDVSEAVGHINGDTTYNVPSNLEIIPLNQISDYRNEKRSKVTSDQVLVYQALEIGGCAEVSDIPRCWSCALPIEDGEHMCQYCSPSGIIGGKHLASPLNGTIHDIAVLYLRGYTTDEVTEVHKGLLSLNYVEWIFKTLERTRSITQTAEIWFCQGQI